MTVRMARFHRVAVRFPWLVPEDRLYSSGGHIFGFVVFYPEIVLKSGLEGVTALLLNWCIKEVIDKD